MTHRKKFPVLEDIPKGFSKICPTIIDQTANHALKFELKSSSFHTDCEEEIVEEEVDIENEDNFLLYSKGYPFYKLSKREKRPSMNLHEHFDPKQICDWKKELKNLLKKTEHWDESTNCACSSLFKDLVEFSNRNNFSIYQQSSLFEIFYSCLNYFKLISILNREQLINYFRETLLLYTTQDPPESLRIFSPLECFAIAKLFGELVENNFDVMKHVLCTNFEIEINIV